MIQRFFGNIRRAIFEINFLALDGSLLPINALLDTGFTDWIAIDIQDIQSLDWEYIDEQEMKTARGDTRFNRYRGRVNFDGQDWVIPVLGGEEINEVLLGLRWLETRQLIANRKTGLLMLMEK